MYDPVHGYLPKGATPPAPPQPSQHVVATPVAPVIPTTEETTTPASYQQPERITQEVRHPFPPPVTVEKDRAMQILLYAAGGFFALTVIVIGIVMIFKG